MASQVELFHYEFINHSFDEEKIIQEIPHRIIRVKTHNLKLLLNLKLLYVETDRICA